MQNYKWIIDEENAQAAIFDLEYVKMLPDGTIDKGSRADPTKQADALDTIRYYCDRFFKWYLKAYDPTSQVVPKPEPAPEMARSSWQAIYAIGIGETITCTREEYFSTVRGDVLDQAKVWADSGHPEKARAALNEISWLERVYGFAG